jgi:hypothetical protein
MTFPGLFERMFDDAAVFPPGNAPLVEAVAAHTSHESAPYAKTIGPFVLAAKDLPDLASRVSRFAPQSLRLSMTVPLGELATAVREVAELEAVELSGIEVSVPGGISAAEVMRALRRDAPSVVPLFVEVPRDERREAFIAALPGTAVSAKLRTGGVRPDAYPDELELAQALMVLVQQGVEFKATAGLHHALRNTDPETGFEQHGFLNILIATARAQAGAGVDELRAALAARDAETVVDSVRELGSDVRNGFRSFGTCSVIEPISELIDLGLLPAHYLVDAPS